MTWSESVRSSTSSLKGDVSESSLTSASDEISNATGKLEDDLKGLGKPNTEGALSGQLKTDIDMINNAVDDVSGASGVVQAVSTVSSTLATVGNQVRAAFTDLQKLDTKGELEQAFKNADSCKTLSKQGG